MFKYLFVGLGFRFHSFVNSRRVDFLIGILYLIVYEILRNLLRFLNDLSTIVCGMEDIKQISFIQSTL